MDLKKQKQLLKQEFPIFEQLEVLDFIIANGHLMEVPAGTELLQAGVYIQVVPLIIEGSVKVFREDEEGRELFLYYIQSGQSCAMTLASTLKMEKSQVRAIAQETTQLFALKVDAVYDLYRKYPTWQHFVIQTFSTRFEELLEVLEGVAFHHLDERLEKYLLEKARTLRTHKLQISHQEIATDLASSREVISRLLKQMEKRGMLRIGRGWLALELEGFKNL